MADWVEALFSSGHVVDIALAFIALEYVGLVLRAQKAVRLSRFIGLIHALGPGVCLMMALRCALVGADPLWVAFWLTASLPLHIWDMASRRL